MTMFPSLSDVEPQSVKAIVQSHPEQSVACSGTGFARTGDCIVEVSQATGEASFILLAKRA
jgi:hypothetical protein